MSSASSSPADETKSSPSEQPAPFYAVDESVFVWLKTKNGKRLCYGKVTEVHTKTGGSGKNTYEYTVEFLGAPYRPPQVVPEDDVIDDNDENLALYNAQQQNEQGSNSQKSQNSQADKGKKRKAPAAPEQNNSRSKPPAKRSKKGEPEPAAARPSSAVPSSLPFKRLANMELISRRKGKGNWKTLKQIVSSENYHMLPVDIPTYSSIEAPPSTIPAKKYCDITGFQAKYTDPKTRLRFCDTNAYHQVQCLSDELVQGFLGIRNAAVQLR